MNNFAELSDYELLSIEGGCTWCRVGATLITVGGVVASGCNPVAVGFGVVAIATTWAC